MNTCFHSLRIVGPLAMIMTLVHSALPAEEPETIFFHENYNEALCEAKLTKKPIFLEFRCAP